MLGLVSGQPKVLLAIPRLQFRSADASKHGVRGQVDGSRTQIQGFEFDVV